ALPGPLQVDKPVLGETLPRPPKKYAGFAREMEKNLGVNVHICSNTRAAALAEARRGGLELDGWVIFVRLGHKVRCAVALDGRLVETESELGGDLGELCVPGNDFTCQCGKVGCINSVAAADAIIGLCQQRGLAVETTNQLIALVQSKDADARDIVRQAASAIGYGIATTINIFSPAAVVVSGPLVESGEAFWSVLDKSVKRYALTENLKRCEIRKANLWKEAEAIGASLFALSRDGLLPTLIAQDKAAIVGSMANDNALPEPVDEVALD
ncbi:MAG: ROK family protein, partial [Candidatus Obscuribacter sp.]|nr:ROK family protein [Candidatus Obscuribacter sp.]